MCVNQATLFPGTAHLMLKVEPKKEGRRDWAEAAV